MPEAFAKATMRMISKLPYWFKMRKKYKEAYGSAFLNIMGMELDEAEHVLNYALKQIHLVSADVTQADVCYRTQLPESLKQDHIMTLNNKDGIQLLPAKTLSEFFTGFSTEVTETPELVLQHSYYIDWEKRVLYSRFSYDIEENYPEGQVQLIIFNKHGKVIADQPVGVSLYHIWNFFDEFGLLLECPRIYGERNKEYKERILDVMRFPGSANYEGLINGIAREVLLKYKEKWYDGSDNFVIKRRNVALHTLMVDDRKLENFEYEVDSSGRIVIYGNPLYEKEKRIVTYAAGIDMKLFWLRADKEFMKELFIPDGDATLRLRQYVKIIKDRVPIEWGQFKWNQGFWDAFHPNKSGTACIPSFCDGSVQGWEKYGGE